MYIVEPGVEYSVSSLEPRPAESETPKSTSSQQGPPASKHRARPRNQHCICKYCGAKFMAADPKCSACSSCNKCAACGQQINRSTLKRQYCRSCGKKNPTVEQQQQLRRLHESIKGENNPAKRREVRRAISAAVTRNHPSRLYPEQWQEIALHMRQKSPNISKLEDTVAKFLPRWKRQYSCGPYSLDFADPERMLIIEIKGCFYHSCQQCFPGSPTCGKQKDIRANDLRRESYLSMQGWHLSYIWEHDITAAGDHIEVMVRRFVEKLCHHGRIQR